ncbi:MAG: hypothetical protein EOO70_00145 [Myxococcaceae bacterium]|nr:MAG: hypothetical protein EOO70_00145 [Myxococcaceae bacterium]
MAGPGLARLVVEVIVSRVDFPVGRFVVLPAVVLFVGRLVVLAVSPAATLFLAAGGDCQWSILASRRRSSADQGRMSRRETDC